MASRLLVLILLASLWTCQVHASSLAHLTRLPSPLARLLGACPLLALVSLRTFAVSSANAQRVVRCTPPLVNSRYGTGEKGDSTPSVYAYGDGDEKTTTFWHPRQRTASRSLNQRRDATLNQGDETCRLTRSEIDEMYHVASRTWSLNDRGLDSISYDVQSVIDCSDDGDVILFDVAAPIKPPRRITIPRNLTLSSATASVDLEQGIFPKADKQTVFQCPRNGGAFLVKTRNVLFANVAFEDCRLEEKDGAVVEVDRCSAEDGGGKVQLRHVAFRRNVLDGAMAFSVQGSECSTVEMVDVEFADNVCGDACFAQLSGVSDLRQITIKGNAPVASDAQRRPSLLSARPGSVTIVVGLEVSGNAIAGLQVIGGTLTLRTSVFVRNSDGPLVQLESGSVAEIIDCRFRRNRDKKTGIEVTAPDDAATLGHSGALGCASTTETQTSSLSSTDSNVTLRRCDFVDNGVQGDGGALFASAGSLRIDRCLFERNAAAKSGGAVSLRQVHAALDRIDCRGNRARANGGCLFLEGATGRLRRLRARSNTASWGGALYIEDARQWSVESSVFRANVAELGGGVFEQRGDALFTNSSFRNNEARSGGGVHIHDGNATFEDVVLTGNEATDSGGAMLIESPKTQLTRCTVEKNHANRDGGGVKVKNRAVLVATDTEFSDNRAGKDGGGLLLEDSRGTLVSCDFTSNVAGNGAGLGVYLANATVESCKFLRNNATRDVGGGIQIEERSVLRIADSDLYGNEAKGHGGGIHASLSTMHAQRVDIDQNSCRLMGAGLCILHAELANVTQSTFYQNRAQFGAGIFARNSPLVLNGVKMTAGEASEDGAGIYADHCARVELSNSHFVVNRAQDRGGGLFSAESNVTASGLTFVKNAAVSGGGLYLFEESRAILRDSVFRECLVSDRGGAIAVQQSSLRLRNATFVNGTSQTGGFLSCRGSDVTIRNAKAEGGWANRTGGFMDADEDSDIDVVNLTVTGARAAKGGAIRIFTSRLRARELHVSECVAEEAGGGLHTDPGSSVLCLKCRFEDNAAGRLGGGVSIASASFQRLAYQFDGCLFRGNNATLGGGVHYLSDYTSANCSEPKANCTFVALGGTTLSHNSAESGGGIFASDLTAFRFRCDEDPRRSALQFYSTAELKRMRVLKSDKGLCPSWTHNQKTNFGPDVASYARRIFWSLEERRGNATEMKEMKEKTHVRLMAYRSGDPLPKIRLRVVDQFGQGPAVGSGNSSVEAVMHSTPKGHALFPGNVSLLMEDGTAEFSEISGLQVPGNYVVQIDFSEKALSVLTMAVTVRSCIIGEAPKEDRKLCVRCTETQYRMSKTHEDCQPCPENANCTSANVIHPMRKYWHRYPCSTHMQECLSRGACDYDREESLESVTADMQDCSYNETVDVEYGEAQCDEGHVGPLCGDCRPGFGHTSSLNCERCDEGLSIVYVVLSILTVMALSSFAIKSSLAPALTPVQQMVRILRRAPSDNVPRMSSAPVTLQMIEDSAACEESCRQGASSSQLHGLVVLGEDSQRRAETAKCQIVEIFKITINFLQVLSVAIHINANWTPSASILLSSTDMLGGMMSNPVAFSIECLVPADAPVSRTVAWAIVNMAIPVVSMILYAVFWLGVAWKCGESWNYVKQRSTLSLLAVAYLTYVWITKTAMSVLYCVGVHDSVDVDADHVSHYWARATSLKCYQGSHAILAGTLGWPVAVVFTAGFPLFLLLTLQRRRDPSAREGWFMEATAFLYRAYSDKYIYWESIIMLRKALLTIVVAFGYHLGANLQAVIAVCILMTAMYVHTVAHPFGNEFASLNTLEGASLLVSNFAFVLALFYHDRRTGDVVRVVLTALLFVFVCGLFGYLVFQFVQATVAYMRVVLEIEGISNTQTRSFFSIFKEFLTLKLNQKLNLAKNYIWKTNKGLDDGVV